jgi:hypothetical protein
VTEKENEKKGMNNAYRIAGELLKDRLKDVDPGTLSELQDIKKADVIVVMGQYDHIEQVLTLAGTPFTLIMPQHLDDAELRPDQIVFINCPGQIGPKGLRKLTTFVSSGGFLFTTDWALKHVLEPAFPGFVEFNQKKTADEVVRVEILDAADPFLKSLLGPNDDPQWWLEGSSYPIRILNEKKVHVLVKSKDIQDKYGESPVFITFDYDEGKIYHMISHFYLQRSETRTKRQKASGADYLNEKEIPIELREKYAKLGIDKSTLGDVESAFTSSVMMSKIIFDKKEQMKKKANPRKENDPQKI